MGFPFKVTQEASTYQYFILRQTRNTVRFGIVLCNYRFTLPWPEDFCLGSLCAASVFTRHHRIMSGCSKIKLPVLTIGR